jgi:putative ABC transport system permease protein
MHTLRNECSNGSLLEDVSGWQVAKHYAGLLFILLFVPALNLCGIVAGRMERRTAEMAVRKTFGACRTTLLGQVISENLVLTSIGGIIGLVAAWLSIYAFRVELLGMFFDSSAVGASPIVTGEMLFAPLLFVGAFAAILVINLLSALLPAWLSLRKPIVESMMEKR